MPMNNTLLLCWHLHQPFYYLPDGTGLAPGVVTFRCLQNYRPMALIASEFPSVRMTFNLTPVLLKQIDAIGSEAVKDDFIELLKDDSPDPLAVMRFGRMIPERHIQQSQIAARLLSDIRDGTARDGAVRDLVVWLHLSAFHPAVNDQLVSEMKEKGRGFSAREREHLASHIINWIAGIPSLYRSLQESGQVEISTSPFSHPILPLLCTTEIVRETSTGFPPPQRTFSAPEDAREQIRLALKTCEAITGRRPVGMWPSEGAVSEEVLNMMADEGVIWTATDEAILFGSVPGAGRNALRRRWTFHDRISVFFRDHGLSDLIGFSYQKMDEEDAAQDLIGRIVSADADDSGGTITILLDGENPWDWYPHFGGPFLRAFYRGIEEKGIRTQTFSGAVADKVPHNLPRLVPGTWMGTHFDNWIGREPANRAWELLAGTRDIWKTRCEDLPETVRQMGYMQILIAEGSDWFWWYSLPADDETKERFDLLFRLNLHAVYRLLGQPVPPSLEKPLWLQDAACNRVPVLLPPAIDGRQTGFFEWRGACTLDPADFWATIRPVSLPISRILLCRDATFLYVRVDNRASLSWPLTLDFGGPQALVIQPGRPAPPAVRWNAGDFLEIAVPWEMIPREGSRFSLRIGCRSQDGTEWTLPPDGVACFSIEEGEDWWV